MTARRHGETEAPLEGFEARIQQGFDWISENPRVVLGTLVGLLLVGALTASLYELSSRSETSAQEALERVERSYAQSLGGDPSLILVPEPASEEQARQSRLQAAAGFEKVVEEHAGTRAAEIARLRWAEVEIDLGERDSAIARLQALTGDLDEDDVLRAIAFRLLGFAELESERFREAAEAFEGAARVEAYPDAAVMWLSAGRNFERADEVERALQAYDSALAVDPQLAEQAQIVERITALEAREAAALAPPAAGEVGATAAGEPGGAEPAEPGGEAPQPVGEAGPQ